MIREVIFRQFERYKISAKSASPFFIKLLDVDGDGEAEIVVIDLHSNISIYKVCHH